MRRHGFTLIEILIAATVMGLGVLGLTTLFAGAARQQQIASDLSQSSRVARNIDSLLSNRFEGFGGVAMVADPALSGSGRPYFAPGQWHPVPAAPMGGLVEGVLDGTLLLDFADNGIADQTAYGVAQADELVLYRAPWGDVADVPISAWGNATNGVAGAGLPSTSYDIGTIEDLALVNNAIFRPSPDGRLEPGFRVSVSYAFEFDTSEGGFNPPVYELRDAPEDENIEFEYLNYQDVNYLRSNPRLWPYDPDPPGPGFSDLEPGLQGDRFIDLVLRSEANAGNQVDAPGGVGGSSDSWLRIEVQRPGQDDFPTAQLVGAHVPLPDNTSRGGRYIVRDITLTGATYREDRLLSLRERLATTADTAFPGGQRPSRAVSVFYRRTLDGRDQLMTVAYTLEPLGRVTIDPQTEVAFVPPESFDRLYMSNTQIPSEYGLFSQVTLELGYDVNLGRYTLSATRAEDEWAVAKDQHIIVGSVLNPVSPLGADRASLTATPDPGADAAVRVLFEVRDDNTGQLKGVLGDSPRISPPRGGGRSILSSTDGSATELVNAWVMRPIIVSDPGGDESVEWRARPTGTEVITLGGTR